MYNLKTIAISFLVVSQSLVAKSDIPVKTQKYCTKKHTSVFGAENGTASPARSATECCRKCTKDVHCKATMFDKQKTRCTLLDDFVTKPNVDDDTPNTSLQIRLTQECNECPNGWKHFGGQYCYEAFLQSKNWNNAEAYCNELGGGLIVVDSQQVQVFIGPILDAYHGAPGDQHSWIAASDREGTYIWYPFREALTYTNFLTGEPDGGVNEDCLGMSHWFSWEWVDLHCDAVYPFACQKARHICDCDTN